MIILSSPRATRHRNETQHPECPDRLTRLQQLFQNDYKEYWIKDYDTVDLKDLPPIHDQAYLQELITLAQISKNELPIDQFHALDSDTAISNGTIDSMEDAFGAIVTACDMIKREKAKQVFCATRPPGHHAEHNKAMGFCFIGWAYLAAHILSKKKSEKVMIIDFDVHHGNGTQDLVEHHFKTTEQENVFYASLHETPLFPGTGQQESSLITPNNILNIPYPPQTGSVYFRTIFEEKLLPYIERVSPSYLILSAGFDAHMDDPLSTAKLNEDDYYWMTQHLTQLDLPIISILEGGYNLDALENCVTSHLDALFNL